MQNQHKKESSSVASKIAHCLVHRADPSIIEGSAIWNRLFGLMGFWKLDEIDCIFRRILTPLPG
jgi:hypothetical protein